MKTFVASLLACLVLGLSASQCIAAELNWSTDLAKAQNAASVQKKSVLLFFHGSDWCPPCVEMQRDVIASKEFAAFAERELVLVDVDFPEKTPQAAELKRANRALKTKFNVGDAYPTVVLLDETGATAFQESGYSGGGPAPLISSLKKHVTLHPTDGTLIKFTNLSVDEFEKMTADKQNIILDVRTPDEFSAGHIAGAINLDVNAADFAAKAASLDKGKTYLVHCASGVRSVKACDKLATLDFPKLYNLPGGFKAWAKAGKPVEK